MNTKRLLTILLALAMMLALCACGNDAGQDTTATTLESTAATTQPVVTTVAAEPSYTVKVVDGGGNPIAGAYVQLCLETCTPAVTDENGVASFFNMEDANYDVKLMAMPSGYEYATGEEVFHFASGSNELTITLKAVA